MESGSYIKGKAIGTTTVVATHMITKATGTATVYVCNQAKINVYYDNAFAERVTLSTGESPEFMITKYFELPQLVYARDFHIKLKLYYMIPYSSYPETDCEHGDASERNLLCDCSSACENHHKNIYNIFDEMPDANKTVALNLLITGHKTCNEDYDTGDCVSGPNSVGGIGNLNRGCAIVGAEICSIPVMQGLIAHELGHLFADNLDHYGSYGYPSTNTNSYQSQNCIWGENKESMFSSLTMCESCKYALASNSNRYSHN